MDTRKQFIVSNAASCLGLNQDQRLFNELHARKEIESFLDDMRVHILNISLIQCETGPELTVVNQLQPDVRVEISIIFFKKACQPITAENMRNTVSFFTLTDSAVSALYHSLKAVYCPTLMSDKQVDPKLQRMMADLQSGLGTALFNSDSSSHVIFSPADELKYWTEKPHTKTTLATISLLEPISKVFSAACTGELGVIEELVNEATGLVDDLWKSEDANYPEDRMQSLLEVCGNLLYMSIQTNLDKHHLWNDSFTVVDEKLGLSLVILQTWSHSCKRHTSVVWPNYPPHRWTGKVFQMDFVERVIERLTEIRRLRAFHKQLAKLLTQHEQDELRVFSVFDVFDHLSVLNCTSFAEEAWQHAVKRFHKGLASAQDRVSEKLRSQLEVMASNPAQLIQEFSRYRELIRYDSIRKQLISERESLGTTLNDYIASVRREFRACNGRAPVQLFATPTVVNNIYWAKNLERQVSDAESVVDSLLNDIDQHEEIKNAASQFLSELRDFHESQFASWSAETLEMVADKALTLSTDSQVVKFNENKQMQVTYNRKLTGLVREVRQLMVLGYSIPTRIVDAANLAKNYLSQATSLEQIANFHNTIGDRIIDSQKPMLLESALSFEMLVKNQKGTTWNNREAVNSYIFKLQNVIDRFARDNNRLIVAHNKVGEEVMALMETDLLRHQQKWKDKLRDIRDIFYSLESVGFKDQKTWKSYWDRQIYKSLDHQYQLGLETLSENMSEVRVELVYRNNRLQLAPPIEEIRLKYYNQMKRFLNIPLNFRGVDSSNYNSIFRSIIERNAFRFNKLFLEAENIFLRLERCKARFESYVVLGSSNIVNLLEEHCKSTEDFEKNFRCSKAKAQEIGRVQFSDEKIGCITVMYGAIKSEIERINRQYWDAVVVHLQQSIVRQGHTVNAFIVEFTEKLARQPQTAAEVGLSASNRNEAIKRMPEMQIVIEQIHKQNRLLAHWTKDNIQQVEKISAKWDQFISLLDSFDVIMAKQIDVFKSNLTVQISQNLDQVERFGLKWKQFQSTHSLYSQDYQGIIKAIETFKVKRQEWSQLISERNAIIETCKQFDISESGGDTISSLQEEINNLESMFQLFEEYHKGMEVMLKEEWLVFRSKLFKFEDYLVSWRRKLLDMKSDNVVVKLTKYVDQSFEILPHLQHIRGEAFSDTHWRQVFHLLNLPSVTSVEHLTFGDLLAARTNIFSHKERLEELSVQAAGEIAIRQALQELDAWEVEARFSLFTHTKSDGSSVQLIREWKDLLNKIGDFQILLQSLKESRHYATFADRVGIWEKRLVDLSNFLTLLNLIQRKWVYLEPIFGRGALPDEQSRFKRIDNKFGGILSDISSDVRVISLCKYAEFHDTLPYLWDQLQRCQRSLSEFLEVKRNLFPRFYFIGDDDLLEILGRANDVEVIQVHLKKLFAGIFRVEFDVPKKNIISMVSADGEVVKLKKEVELTNNVDEWLRNLSAQMKNTLQYLVNQCLDDSRANKLDPTGYPSQVISLTENIIFTERCQRAIVGNKLIDFLEETKKKLSVYTSQKVDTQDLSGKILSLKLNCLVLETIQHIRIVEDLLNSSSTSLDDWSWQKQLRYYSESGLVKVRMVDAEFAYTYEYQGNIARMVQTPLNEKCFLTMTQAMKMGMGGNPYGPAGTGKTESIKHLGNCFGRQVIVFNCDEGIDVKSMARIFTGIVMSGAWGCFDEFNRLEESVLSALSTQVQTIQTALKDHVKTIEILDKSVNVDQSAAVFITMNPADKDYGGRSKLPDNLRQLFRPVAMSNPDIKLIVETLLYAEGFKNARKLGNRIHLLFKLASELLSPQRHYDWGLRAQKPVVMRSGSLLKSLPDVNANELLETECVVNAVKLNTMSKLIPSDVGRFQSLLSDVFPGVVTQNISSDEFLAAVKQSYKQLGFVEDNLQIQKIIEVHEQLGQRVGCILVGPSGCGKSTILKVLLCALRILDKKLRIFTLNPKAITRSQLLGYIDSDTREWYDGVLTSISRQVILEDISVTSWIVCDGDIDPDWIESLNSVLDGNRILTMPSGERIQFGVNVNFIFETDDLTHASPATVTRMGVIYISSEATLVRTVISAWLNNLKDSVKDVISDLFEKFAFKAIDLVLEMNAFEVDISVVSTVLTCLDHLIGERVTPVSFCAALVKGLSSNLKRNAKMKLAAEVMNWVGETLPDSSDPMNFVYNSKYDRLDKIGECQREHSSEYGRAGDFPFVPTKSGIQVTEYLDIFLNLSNKPILLVGNDGCGKSRMLKDYAATLKSTAFVDFHCNVNTSSLHIMTILAQQCIQVTSNTGKVLKPKGYERIILFIRNINLPAPDKYGTSSFIEFLTQLFGYNGFWDNSLEWVSLQNVQVVCSMVNIRSPGRNSVSRRFSSIIRIVCVDNPDVEQLGSIHSVCLRSVFAVYPDGISTILISKTSQLCASTLLLQKKFLSSFSSTEIPHYLFTLHDLNELVLGLARYDYSTENTVNDLIEAWVNEICRLFRDRLVSDQHRSEFDRIVDDILTSEWSFHRDKIPTKYFVHIPSQTNAPNATAGQSNSMVLDRLSREEWAGYIERAVSQYIAECRDVEPRDFSDILDTLAHLNWCLSRPGGSVIMAGRSGIGRRTAAGVVSYMLNLTVVTIKIGRGYSLKKFQADIKSFILLAGTENRQVLFLIESHELIDEAFLPVINYILCKGEVPGLFSVEETEAISVSLKSEHSNDGSNDSIFDYFSARVRKNLHIALTMDFTESNFNSFCWSNPNLMKACSFIWLYGWSESTMSSLPLQLINDAEGMLKWSDEFSSQSVSLAEYFKKVHNMMPEMMRTPRKYIEFIKTFCTVYTKRRNFISERQEHLLRGVNKINEASMVVAKLKKRASEQEEKLITKQSEVNRALSMIKDTMKSASRQKEDMEALSIRTREENLVLQKKKRDIEQELAEVEPLIKEAKMAVGSIKSESLSEVRVLRVPPEVIRDILEGVMGLLGINDASWNNMKIFLGRRTVKDDILNFDARNISSTQRKHVSKLLKERSSSFDLENAKRASKAAEPLAAWVKANVKYSSILEKIKPLENELNSLQKNLSDAQISMEKLGNDLSNVDKYVQELTDQLNVSTRDAAVIEIDLQKAKETLSTSETLVNQLVEEHLRWNDQLKHFNEEITVLSSLSLLSAAFIVYLSDASLDKRVDHITHWCRLVGLENFNLTRFLSSERETLNWKNEGLPSDDFSVDNGVIIKECQRCVLLIDPSSNAIDWLKAHLQNSKSKCELISQRSDKFHSHLESAVRFGKTVVIEEFTGFEPLFLPLIRRDISTRGTRQTLQFGDKVVDYDPKFKIYFTTRNTEIQINPNYRSCLTIVNFRTTRSGLSGHLLTISLQADKPELAAKREQVVKQEDENKVKLIKLEDELLSILGNTEGNILENQVLLKSLGESKASAIMLSASMEENKSIQTSLEDMRLAYSPLADYGSRLFFAVSDISSMNHTYQYSLSSYIKLFEDVLRVGVDRKDLKNSIPDLKLALFEKVYSYVSRSLLKKDRLTFILHLVHSLRSEEFGENEWDVFIGKVAVTKNEIDVLRKTTPTWISDDCVLSASAIRTLLPTLWQTLTFDDDSVWSGFMSHVVCEKNFPRSIAGKLTPFQQLLVIQAIRPDRLHSAMNAFIDRICHQQLAFPRLNLAELHHETTSTTPIMVLFLPGTDPSEGIFQAAKRSIGSQKFHEVPMGRDQSDVAVDMMKRCSAAGEWLCLKNIHLDISWIPQLEQELRCLQPHEDFRLWLTTQPHPGISPTLLLSSLKVTYEAPPGIKENIMRTYSTWGPGFFNRDNVSSSFQRSQIMFAVAWLHALVVERRSYVPGGWTKQYEFGPDDLQCGFDVIERCVGSGNFRWDFIHGLMENVVYGNRIDNTSDSYVFQTYVREVFNNKVIPGSHAGQQELTVGIRLPASNVVDDYLNLLRKLHDVDLPEYFGLPQSIDRNVQKTTGTHVTSQLLVIARSLAHSDAYDRDKWQKELSPVLNLWKKLNSGVNLTKQRPTDDPSLMTSRVPEVQSSISAFSETDPIVQFLQLEYNNGLRLVQLIHNGLAGISKAIRGGGQPSPDVLQLAENLLLDHTPQKWQESWLGPVKPLPYLRAIVGRTLCCERWTKRAVSGSLVSSDAPPLDLSELFCPHVFLNAVRQSTCRLLNVPINDLKLITEYRASPQNNWKMPLRLSGVLLEGGRFDSVRLTSVGEDPVGVTNMPVFTIAWSLADTSSLHATSIDCLSVPLYENSTRQKLITHIDIPCPRLERPMWIKAGLALFLKD